MSPAAGNPHPNLAPSGLMCLPMLHTTAWGLANTLEQVVAEVHRVLLEAPDFGTTLNDGAVPQSEFEAAWQAWAKMALTSHPPCKLWWCVL